MYARIVHIVYPINVPMVANFRKCFLPPFLSVKIASVGDEKRRSMDDITNIALYQKSDNPPSITSHCEKYSKKLISTKEFAKSYNDQ